jgi:hypothetical protein
MDQTQLLSIYNHLYTLLKPYESRGFQPKIDIQGKYDLWAFGDFQAHGKKRKEMFFVGLTVQSSYVGFYFMPIYSDPHISDLFGKDLLKTLKGKSCFHIKSTDPNLLDQIRHALEEGYKIYTQRGRSNKK